MNENDLVLKIRQLIRDSLEEGSRRKIGEEEIDYHTRLILDQLAKKLVSIYFLK